MIAIIISLIICGLFLYFWNRNDKTCDFRIDIIKTYLYNDDNWKIKNEIYSRVSYSKMWLSFKSLKLESYYTAEEIEILTKKEENLDLAK